MMDPHIVFDCEKVLPNRFALTLAAAARSRALNRGAEPRLDIDDASVSDLALHEIAAGVFTREELTRRFPGRTESVFRASIPFPGFATMAAKLSSPHPPPARGRRFIDDATQSTRRNQQC
ncbi:DNA-directed RNA polymerase subunit omega [Brucella pseudintermedia]|uniref:DNA-directed RNA polymerase subunit omega n=1 Tax=Brucella pseudintermedia TaxID=370111 RepID=UPI001F2A298A|nr:DNA-directed RNA polymerase subunit omega [Brucella pseudintermedia]